MSSVFLVVEMLEIYPQILKWILSARVDDNNFDNELK